MSELQLNWKRLSSRLAKRDDSKVSKPKSDLVTKAKNQKLKKSISKDIKPIHTSSQSQTVIPEKSGLELALWVKENEIEASDVINSAKFSLQPQGNDARKREPGRFLAIDCEFVGVGPEGAESALARVSIVNFYGHVVYDQFVRPRERVTDWRTWVSGITPKHMNEAIPFEKAQSDVSKLLDKRILVGHAVHHDLDSLFLSHPKSMIRDTTQYGPYRKLAGGRTPSLKKLSQHFLKIDIQDASHSSIEDARATMLLYRLNKNDFEQQLRQKFKPRK
jgi:RNA exonuclease 4